MRLSGGRLAVKPWENKEKTDQLDCIEVPLFPVLKMTSSRKWNYNPQNGRKLANYIFDLYLQYKGLL